MDNSLNFKIAFDPEDFTDDDENLNADLLDLENEIKMNSKTTVREKTRVVLLLGWLHHSKKSKKVKII
ncbi:hypothetical protein SADUNF_Sadunf10G0140600 [Salix dunnii]|uniref:Uncharacterized protein n=1 Tax=Salix dunnii TaxID=1413687 RepID=A0A835MS66_9ROSI|nr:hypothetical protein SADUNF_Sadunf10G0140600 [Salix dunnii]